MDALRESSISCISPACWARPMARNRGMCSSCWMISIASAVLDDGPCLERDRMTKPATRLTTAAIHVLRRLSGFASLVAALAGSRALAQSATAAGEAATHRLVLDGTRLHASHRVYRFVLTDTSVRSLGEVESRVAESQHGGVTA